MSFFVRGSRKKQLSWDGPRMKQRPVVLHMQLVVCTICASQQLCPLMGLPHLIWDGVVGKAVGEQWFYAML